MTEKELLSAFLSKTLNMDDTAVASLYKEDGSEINQDSLETLLKLDVERVQKLKPDTKKEFDNGYKKAQSEVLSSFEKEFKEKTGHVSEKKGLELVLEYASKQTNATELKEDAVKRHPIYLDAIEKLTKEKDEAVKLEQNKFVEFENGIKKKETFGSVANKAIEIFNNLKPILSKDPSKQANQLEDFKAKLGTYEYEIQGDRILVLKDGKALEDAHGNRIPFEKIVKETADRYYDFQVAEQRSSAANQNQQNSNNQGKTFNIQVPKTEAEYTAFITDKSKPIEERTAVQEAWMKQSLVTNN
jgi:hypothetical protein